MNLWDQYFMSIAFIIAAKSKDPSTKVGAVIVGEDKEVRSTGYNGMPRGFYDSNERYTDKTFKYAAIVHAEENAIANASRIGISVRGCDIYVFWRPCLSCARLIVQSGIKSVISYKQFPGNTVECSDHWDGNMNMATDMLQEAGVEFRYFDGPLLGMRGVYNGCDWTPETT